MCQHPISKKKNTFCAGDIWYQISKTPNPDKVFCSIDVTDSTLFYYFISNENRLKIDVNGSLFDLDSFRTMNHEMFAYNIDYTVLIGQQASDLTKYERTFLDSLIQRTREELKIVITDTLSRQKWEFIKCKVSNKNVDKEWFKNVPPWIFYNDL